MPRRNSHCSGVNWIHLPLRASMACLGTETSTHSLLSAAATIWGKTAKAPANARERMLNMRTSFKVGALAGCFPRLTNFPIVLFADRRVTEAETLAEPI